MSAVISAAIPKPTASVDDFLGDVDGLLDAIHDELYDRALKLREACITDVTDLSALEALFKADHNGFARIDVSVVETEDYERIKKEHGLTSRCTPLDTPDKVIVGKAY